MLVLSRRVGERLVIGDDIVVTVIEVRSDGVRLGIDAPRSVSVHRAEVLDAVRASNVAATDAGDDAVESLRGLLAPAADDAAADDGAADDDATPAAPGEPGPQAPRTEA
jgi:carbon storage regulator